MSRFGPWLRGSALAAALLWGCDDPAPSTPASPISTPSSSTAVALDVVSRAVEADPRDEAVATFRRDAFRREARFMDALSPGHRFATTRVSQAEIDAGRWSTGALFRIGGHLFDLSFTPPDGLGDGETRTFVRVHRGQRGGPDAAGCSECHWRGGRAGAGDGADVVFFDGDGDRPGSGLARNPPALVGAGWLERAAAEMSEVLAARRSALVRAAAERGGPVREALASKGVGFGYLTAYPDGRLDTAELEGVDPDLVVKPFGRKGLMTTVRDMVEESLRVHHGMQSTHLVAHGHRERMGDGPPDDPDGDGVIGEIIEGQVTALSLFVALQEVPVEVPPPDPRVVVGWGRGRVQFEAIGCAVCHTPSLVVTDPVWRLSHRDGGPALAVDLAVEAAEPRVVPSEDGAYMLRLFSDLKRHDMGDDLADPRGQMGVAAAEFVTPPLWGVAQSRPYLHDGRAPTIEDAIRLHGGEGAASRDAYLALEESERATVRLFLVSLSRAPRFTVR